MTRHIIIIDHDQTRRETVRKALRPEGFEAVTFECGKDAARHLMFSSTEAALIDFSSAYDPYAVKPNSKRILQEIRAIDPSLPLVVISDQPLSLDQATASAVAFFLRRPVTTLQLKNALHSALAKTIRERADRESASLKGAR